MSGGGYIGSFLSAWLAREHLAAESGNGWPAVWERLTGRSSPEDEAQQISWLRTYSNYLTPRLGVASADLWAAVAIFVRNLILNWLVIIPCLCAVLIVLKAFALGVGWLSQLDPRDQTFFVAFARAAIAAVFIALAYANLARPTHGRLRTGRRLFLRWDLAPAVVSALLFTLAIACPASEAWARSTVFSGDGISASGLGYCAAMGFILFACSWPISWPKLIWREFLNDWLAWSVSGVFYGALLGVGVFLYFAISDRGLWFHQPREMMLLICGPPWVFLSQLIAEMLFVGLSSYESASDSDREWLGRSAGWYVAAALSWLMMMALVYLGSKLAGELYGQIATWLAGGGAALLTAGLGKSSSTGSGAAGGRKWLSKDSVLALAAMALAVALIVGLSGLLDQIIFGRPLVDTLGLYPKVSLEDLPPWRAGMGIFIAFAIAVCIAAFASYFVNINRFSLHALYRNRIIRAFLGASNATRRDTRDLFTDFNETDNVRVSDLWPEQAAPPAGGAAANPSSLVGRHNWRPFHVINMALNVVSTKRLAWQERKAESFVATPSHSGSSFLGFRDSAEYGDPNGGISLGTAVAISGAAASPNMGYHSSPGVAFLMTMLNVRLGWWLGNPGKAGEAREAYKQEGPPNAIKPLVCEMFGQTTDERSYVYLSDGGHFENLGLYEMVRRRCKFIIVVDAGCDKEFAFEDLGNAVRKISIDLGVSIVFRGLDDILFRANSATNYPPNMPRFHAIGRIDYPSADGGGDAGIILYIKPAFHPKRIANVGVRNYAVAHPEFPHESTSDQWFSESQLESYRALGFEVTNTILAQALQGPALGPNASMSDIFSAFDRTVP